MTTHEILNKRNTGWMVTVEGRLPTWHRSWEKANNRSALWAMRAHDTEVFCCACGEREFDCCCWNRANN